jgi:hypothetical protein
VSARIERAPERGGGDQVRGAFEVGGGPVPVHPACRAARLSLQSAAGAAGLQIGSRLGRAAWSYGETTGSVSGLQRAGPGVNTASETAHTRRATGPVPSQHPSLPAR